MRGWLEQGRREATLARAAEPGPAIFDGLSPLLVMVRVNSVKYARPVGDIEYPRYSSLICLFIYYHTL
jgi:hypothetical protein